MNAEARFATSHVNTVLYIGLTRSRGKWQYDIRPEMVVKPIFEYTILTYQAMVLQEIAATNDQPHTRRKNQEQRIAEQG